MVCNYAELQQILTSSRYWFATRNISSHVVRRNQVYSTCTHVLELVVCLLPDTPTHPQFPTGLYTVLLIDVSTSINKAMFKEMQHFIDQMVDGKSYQYYTMA